MVNGGGGWLVVGPGRIFFSIVYFADLHIPVSYIIHNAQA